MANRGRPRMSDEEKSLRKAEKELAKFAALAANALAKLPAEKQRRDEIFAEEKELREGVRSAAGALAAHKKREREVYGMTPKALRIRDILLSCKDGEYEATCEQVQLFMQDAGRPFQLSMQLQPGKGVGEDTGSVFDTTAAGEHVSAERGDDPAKARKRTAKAPEPAAEPAPGLSIEEAERRFREANEAKAGSARASAGAAALAGDEHIKQQLAKNPLEGAEGTGSYRLQ